MSDLLKLMALDEEDLTIISAHTQDAVLRVKDIVYDPQSQSLTLFMNRFAWEAPAARRWLFKKFERRLAALTFRTVLNVQRKGIRQEDPDQIVSLLTITLDSSGQGQSITLHGSDGVAIRADVEAVEGQLTDLGGAWEAKGKPHHPLRGAPKS